MSIKKVIQAICVFLEIICFLPTITVSCSNETVKLTAINAVKGYEDAGGGEGIYVLMFILPIISFVILLAAFEYGERSYYIGAIIPFIADMIIWNSFKEGVIGYAKEQGYGAYLVETTNWYLINQILMVIAIVLCAVRIILPDFVMADIINNANKIKPVVNTESASRTLNNVKETVMVVSGAAVEAAKEQKEKHAKEEMERKIAQANDNQSGKNGAEICYCTQCGKQLNTSMNFCKYCGAKLK